MQAKSSRTLQRWSVIYVLDSMGCVCEAHALGNDGKLVRKRPQHRRKFNSSEGTSPPSYHQLSLDMPKFEPKSTDPDSKIGDDSILDATSESHPVDPLEITVSIDDDDVPTEGWFTPDWF
jgi:hypothetical protein